MQRTKESVSCPQSEARETQSPTTDATPLPCIQQVIGAKKIARESVTPNCSVSLAEFEELAQAAVSELHAEEHIDYDAEHRWD